MMLKNQQQQQQQANSRFYSNSKQSMQFEMKLEELGNQSTLQLVVFNEQLDEILQTTISQELVFEVSKKQKTILYPGGLFDHLAQHFAELRFTPQGDIVFQYYLRQQTISLHKKSRLRIYRDLQHQISQIQSAHLAEMTRIQLLNKLQIQQVNRILSDLKGELIDMKGELIDMKGEHQKLSQLSQININGSQNIYDIHRQQMQALKMAVFQMKDELLCLRQYRSGQEQSVIAKKLQQKPQKSANSLRQMLNQLSKSPINNQLLTQLQMQLTETKQELRSLAKSLKILEEKADGLQPECKQLIKDEMQIFMQDNQNIRQQIEQLKVGQTSKGQVLSLQQHQNKDTMYDDLLQINPHCPFVNCFQLQPSKASLRIAKNHQQQVYSTFISKFQIWRGSTVQFYIDVVFTKQYNIEIGLKTISHTINSTNSVMEEDSDQLMCFLWSLVQDRKKSRHFQGRGFMVEVNTVKWFVRWFVKGEEVPFQEVLIPQRLRQSALYPAINIFDDKDTVEIGYIHRKL